MKTIKIISIILLIFQFQEIKSQEIFTLDNAIEIAIKYNHGLQISRNDITIAKNSANLGNAGLMPSLDLNINGSKSILDTEIEFNGNMPNANQDGAASSYLSGSLDLSYTVFDRGKSHYRLKTLREETNRKQLNFTASVERTMIDVINAYYNLVNTQAGLINNIATFNYSLQRYNNISSEVKYGQNTNLEKLTALGYVNSDSTRVLNSRLMLQKNILDLNNIFGVDTLKGNEIFASTIALKTGINKQELYEKMLTNNIDIQTDVSRIYTSELDMKTAKYFYMPKISLKASYNYTNQDFEVGTMLMNKTMGPTIGFTVSRNVFSGGKKRKEYQNARISYENSQINLTETQFKLKQNFEKSWIEYQYYLNLIPIEESNLKIAEERFKKTQSQYKLGQLSNLEFRDAQINLKKTKTTLNETKINAKLAEWELLRISGLITGN